ncbi:MAG TPA: tRNA (N(6)-L-threonylcarbamoyladenosine(37)-C(2))-methylthiotransferase MtaB [Acholeplasmataceae bacterium]|jgi:threonylcarbamoyladenosine tRNA methylthiotransferase MtaB|nr:tRNA (N(6)-L-threonylcarbamoyladenosine(37)-C(2))-methylthiotransferase MtaB [Acholeplasmataceae bacterium]
MKVSYCSLGCKVNEYEAVAIINQFLDSGFKLVNFDEEADVYIINTCTVTANSDAKSRKMIRQATRRNPDAVVAVMGCFSQLHPDDVKEIGADVVIGTSHRHHLFNLCLEALDKKDKHFYIDDMKTARVYEEIKIDRYLNHTRGFIKIEDGCDNFCSYCEIPYARGRVRSRKADDIISEIEKLTAQGMKELVLSGINTGAYGQDLEGFGFVDLLAEILKVKGLGRIRISSIEVTQLSTDLLKLIKANRDHFCNHFHIPLQNGNDEILKLMNRKYDTEFFSKKIKEIRKIFPDANITTDYMVGFPGETTEQFQNGLEFARKVGFGEMHVFPYSPRPHTRAKDFPNQLDGITKRFRVNEMLNLNREMALAYRQQFEKKRLEVLVEKNENGIAFGHTSNYLQVSFPSQANNNELVYVTIEKADYPVSLGKE